MRSHFAAHHGLSTPDTIGLLADLGADGAVQAVRAGAAPAPEISFLPDLVSARATDLMEGTAARSFLD